MTFFFRSVTPADLEGFFSLFFFFFLIFYEQYKTKEKTLVSALFMAFWCSHTQVWESVSPGQLLELLQVLLHTWRVAVTWLRKGCLLVFVLPLFFGDMPVRVGR